MTKKQRASNGSRHFNREALTPRVSNCLRRRGELRWPHAAVLTLLFLLAYFTHLVGFVLALAGALGASILAKPRSFLAPILICLPVVTLAGPIHVSRVAVSILSNIGLPELIANDSSGYVQICANLAADVPRLQSLRAGMRERFRSSPLGDGVALVRELERAYRQMWESYCSGGIGRS